MNTIRYYRASCGSIYRVTTTEATSRNPANYMQARKGPKCNVFSPEYHTSAEEVAKLVAFQSFIEIPAP
ncbi:hypothetical protein [Hymenobacter rubripertinctus]|uniref:Uncharacterized protein n=1 Tax=Hymenobacter rubripertinctus TaxID=2029981 RepID=A0A418R8L9_9BACT|nr:hypothetical protein [Hymenobacter rubripertinctus]RIY13756.1 hypothetical protein D0T11_01360 [Hymenobacter rubripertinctus]